VNPETGQEQLLDNYNTAINQTPALTEQEDGYVFGRYHFHTDLLTKEIIADNLIDATQDGGKLLVSTGDDANLDVLCQDKQANRTFPLIHITRNETSEASLSGKFSPDGIWLWIRSYVGGKPVYRLARCDSSAPLLLPGGLQGTDPYFSTDSNWLVIEQTYAARDELANIAVLELKTGQIKEIPAELDTHSSWFQMPGSPAFSSSSISSTTLPSGSGGTTTTNENNPIKSQIGGPKGDRLLVFISLILWASTLVAIVIVAIYRWKYPRK